MIKIKIPRYKNFSEDAKNLRTQDVFVNQDYQTLVIYLKNLTYYEFSHFSTGIDYDKVTKNER